MISHSKQADEEKTSRLHGLGKAVRLIINPSKTKSMNLNFEKNDPITTGGDGLEDIEDPPTSVQGGTEADIKRRLALLRSSFSTLKPL